MELPRRPTAHVKSGSYSQPVPYAKNHDATFFDAALASISYKVPYGHAQLNPTWQQDETLYDPAVRGSGIHMVQQIKADLTAYVQTAVADGTIRFS